MSSKKKNIYTFLGKVILITLLIVLFVRTFLIEPYTVSSTQMEASLLTGDRILIDKTAYGVRLPITILTIPFTFDSFFDMKSYSSAVEIPYKRILEEKVERNDIILFNNPVEADKPLDKRNLIISRCIALSGDSVQVKNGNFFINDYSYVSSPNVVDEYIARISDEELDEAILESEISVSNRRRSEDTVFLRMSRFDAFVLNENLVDSVRFVNQIDSIDSYNFLIPYKGKIIDIDARTLSIYGQVILQEQGTKARLKDDILYIDNKEQKEYAFEDNYYWVISDNTTNALDSRTIGFIPFRNIIGKANMIWYSRDKERCFTKIEK